MYAGDQNLLLEVSPQKANGVYRITGVPVDSTESRIAKIISIEDIDDIPMVGRYRRFVVECEKKY
jgi:hypothetical protein